MSRPGPPPGEIERRALAGLLGLLLLVAFAFQGTRGIWEPDEGRYSAAGINMLESGDWLVPSVDGEHPHLSKPPVTYWALAASFALLGLDEWAARLPSALAFVGTGLLLLGLGRRLCAPRPWLPAAVWATSFAPVVASNVVSTDPILVLWETAAMFAFVEGWSRHGNDGRRWYVLMWLGWGGAFLTKGPPGVLPLLAMLAFLAVHDRPRLRSMCAPDGIALFVVVGFSWFALLIVQDPARLRYFLDYELYDRVFTGAHDRHAQWYGGLEVYLPVLLAGTLPWFPLALLAAGGPARAWQLARARLQERSRDWLLLAYWLLVPLAVFFVARSRLHLYVLPLFVPLSLAMARPLAGWRRLAGRRLAALVVVAALAMVAFKGTLAYWPSDRDARELAAQLRRFVDPREVDEIVFVGMRPFYGLTLYLDRHIAELQVGKRRHENSKLVQPVGFCGEIADHPRAVYGIKRHHATELADATRPCGVVPRPLGTVRADGNDILFFELAARADQPDSG